MADLGYYDDKLQKDGDPNQQQPQAGAPTQGGSNVVSGGGTSGANTSGVGAGGQGSWTNIQSYLNANKSDTGSANSLNQKVGGVLGQEKQKLDTQVNDTVNQANDVAKTYDTAKNDTKEWVNKAASAYSWGGQHGDDYRNTVNNVQGLMKKQYEGPKNFTYANSQDMSRADDALKDDNAFKGYLGDMYKERTGGVLNSGQA
ncbi:MAG: hypothetical protein H0X02_01625, partial [Nitrosomonas sp.]|nr:hypothetical protein [Nitrosomonas sp.]